MINTTTLEDLAKKIEWVGLCNLSRPEQRRVEAELEEVCRFLPRLLALALWSCYRRRAPDNLVTRSPAACAESDLERENARLYIADLMASYREEENRL